MMGDFIDLFLERRMDSEDGKELKLALESKIAEEKRVRYFKMLLRYY